MSLSARPNRFDHPRARWIALVVVCLGQLMSVLDSTIVNVALPHIQRDLHFGQSSLTWVLNGYLITFGSLLMFGGRLGDLVGRRRVFLSGVAVFTLASLACGLAATQAELVVARVVQGIGGAGAVAVTVAIIAAEFPSPRERAQAMSVYMFVVSGGGSLGLILGGLITELASWHWIFFINLPIGAATFALGRMWLAENPGSGIDRDLDWPGAVLITAGLMAIAYAIVTASTHGWTAAATLGTGGLAVALLAGFVAREHTAANPIMPLRVFRLPGLASSSLIRGLLIVGMFATFFIGVLYLEHVRHYGVLTTGVAFLAQTLTLAALSLGPTAWIVHRVGPRPPLLAGLVLAGAGLAVFSGVDASTPYAPTMLLAFVMIGAGAGLSFMPLLTLAMAGVPVADSGLASGIVNTSLQVSAAIGTAVLGTLSASRTRGLLAHGDAPGHALLAGYRLAFTVGAGCVAAALLAALVWLAVPRRHAQVSETPSAAGS